MGEYRREVELETADGRTRKAVYQHPAPVRLAHWAIAIALPVMVLSGLEIFRAFPSFGPKIPQENLFRPPRALTLGGWLAGGLEWHVTFAWVFLGAGAVYLAYQVASGNLVQILFRPRDLGGVLPMVRHYLFRAPKPDWPGAYNPLQKLAYTITLAAGALAALTGLCLLQPVQLAPVVALHGWNNLRSMATGFKLEAPARPGGVDVGGAGNPPPPAP